MSVLREKLLTPEDEELQHKKASLAELEAQLADRELELASCLADLFHFEKHYLQTVGRRYAMLDDLKGKIACKASVDRLHRPYTGSSDSGPGRLRSLFYFSKRLL